MRTWPALDIEAPDDLVEAALIDFDVAAIDDHAPESWRVFFQTSEGRDRAAAALREAFGTREILVVDVPDEDWAARSQADLRAVRVGSIIVAPPWDVGAEAGRSAFSRPITLTIQPSMGFGTGHHATTRLCLAHLQQIDVQGRSVIDVGTGSGVLAIAASRLGAGRVLAIDDDPDAIQSARENVDLNPGVDVTLGLVDLRRTALRPFDVVMGNLTGGLLMAAASSLLQLTAPGGCLVLSGFMESEEAGVFDAFSSCTIEQRSQEDEWVCATFSRLR